MKQYILSFTAALLMATHIPAIAGGIDYLKVDGSTVYFSSTSPKNTPSPSCVRAENNDMWTVSLSSESGRAMYSLLVTALAKETQFDVVSANDCADKEGFERAQSINLLLGADSVYATKGSLVGIYQADGTTRVGTLIEIDDATGDWIYADGQPSFTPKRISHNDIKVSSIHYSDIDCTGTKYVGYPHDKVKPSNEPWLYKTEETVGYYVFKSIFHNNRCVNVSSSGKGNLYKLSLTNNGACGNGVCQLKIDSL
ncbi:hypothetical protein OE749_08080 [Aestuariibacter sp. AA17]|uniref:Secreted protein n=1 Tax=Fluctibacter corallii TaxID=2984329 RepID=A0ABT3A7J9_9ALTE|nr:hypothetical protein [Aestuariibacter sp. AA17]MCV2884651.1 hypothetical protein [Aestuariibacter sp. AA17]